jgi:hypothetical protein
LRRSLIALALGVVATLSLAGAALAKEGGVELSSTPYGTPPGGTWKTTITLISDSGRFPPGASPTITSAGGDGSFPVRATVVGGIALLLVASGAGLYARRRRLGLSH